MTPSSVSPEPLISHGAGFGIRLLARAVDVVFTLILGLIGGIALGFVLGVMTAMGKLAPGWQQHTQLGLGLSLGVGLISSLLYHSLGEGLGSVTVGKFICGLRVMHADGQPCSLTAAFERNIAYFWDGLFFGAIGYSSMSKTPLQQRYGDHWANTVVVKRTAIIDLPPLKGWRVTLGILAGSFLWATLTFSIHLVHVLNYAD